MAAMAGMLNHPMTAGQAQAGARAIPMAGSTGGTSNGTSDSSGDSATISANDFLTLLVTEMQNQDPTADTDPNEYINQLVSVNSLEQLIDINKNLSTALGQGGSTAGSATPSAQAAASTSNLTAKNGTGANGQAHAAGHKTTVQTVAPVSASTAATSSVPAAIGRFEQAQGAGYAPGNLSIPAGNGAAERVGHALDGKKHALSLPGGPPGSQ
jgi:flagellar basal-body rod modification protein FlgD